MQWRDSVKMVTRLRVAKTQEISCTPEHLPTFEEIPCTLKLVKLGVNMQKKMNRTLWTLRAILLNSKCGTVQNFLIQGRVMQQWIYQQPVLCRTLSGTDLVTTSTSEHVYIPYN